MKPYYRDHGCGRQTMKTDYSGKIVYRYKNFKRDDDITCIEFRVLPVGQPLDPDCEGYWEESAPEALEQSSATLLHIENKNECFGWL